MSLQILGYRDYTCAAGDAFDSIAMAAYNEERMSTTIIQANLDYCDVLIFEGGEKIRIPIVDIVTTADTLPPWRR